jgi:hypothetical protein
LETEAALASESWLDMRQDSVLDFLQMDFMEVKEPDLVSALIKWGRAQVIQNGEDPEDGQKLRSKILPCLKFINFQVLSNREFALLCVEDLGRILSSDEKHAVMMCITLGDWNHMPGELAPVKQPPRLKSTCVFALLYLQGSKQGLTRFHYSGVDLTIVLDRSAKLMGFQIVTPENNPTVAKAFQNFKINLHHAVSDAVVGSGCSKEKLTYEGKEYFKVTSVHQMEAGVTYSLSLKLAETLTIYGIPYLLKSPISYKSNAHGKLELSLHNKNDFNWCAAKITELVFELL